MKTFRTALIFLAMASATVVFCQVFPNAATNPEKGVIMEHLPVYIEDHWSDTIPMSELERKWLPDDTEHVRRVFYPLGIEDENLRNFAALNATIILSGSDHRSLHRPEVCLRAQGWTILQRSVLEVETAGGPLEVMDLRLRRTAVLEDGRKMTYRAHYIYWWVGRDVSTPHAWKRTLLATLNNLLHNVNDRWAYPSVMVNVLGNTPEDEKRAVDRALAFIREYAPQFQKSLGAEERDDTGVSGG